MSLVAAQTAVLVFCGVIVVCLLVIYWAQRRPARRCRGCAPDPATSDQGEST